MLNLTLQKISRMATRLFVKPSRVKPILLKSILAPLRTINLGWAAIIPFAIANTLPAIAQIRIEGLNKVKSPVVERETRDVNEISPFADGAYIFAESNQAGQYGVTYVIFEVRQGITQGAFYQVASEYACFVGTVENRQLNLAVEELGGTSYPHEITLEDRGTVTTSNGVMRAIGLQGFQKLEELSESDREILSHCQKN
ncbi:MAG: hypothetical protein AAGA60_00630 [Cyanobacteria bacterium P01_E01_bin.42]